MPRIVGRCGAFTIALQAHTMRYTKEPTVFTAGSFKPKITTSFTKNPILLHHFFLPGENLKNYEQRTIKNTVLFNSL